MTPFIMITLNFSISDLDRIIISLENFACQCSDEENIPKENFPEYTLAKDLSLKLNEHLYSGLKILPQNFSGND